MCRGQCLREEFDELTIEEVLGEPIVRDLMQADLLRLIAARTAGPSPRTASAPVISLGHNVAEALGPYTENSMGQTRGINEVS